jgi:heme/copper-type cytochrome/quinol oxidase subunit 3
MSESAVSQPQSIPIGPTVWRGVGWWGMWTVIATEAALFAYLLFSYFYLGAQGLPGWLLESHPSLKYALPSTVISVASAVITWWGVRAVIGERRGQALTAFVVTLLLGVVFVWLQILDWQAKPFHVGTSSYSSIYFVTTGLDLVHVLVGLGIFVFLILWTALGYFGSRRSLVVTVGALYWYFVTVIWLAIFATFYISPYLGFGQWQP